MVTDHAYLDPREREYVESLSGEERATVVAAMSRFRRPDSLRVGDPLPYLELLRLEDAERVPLRSQLGDRPLVLVFGSFT